VPSLRRAHLLYRLLAAVTAGFCVLIGIVFLSAFLDRALFQVFARPLFDTNYWGYYILAFAGSALIAWGGCLIAAVRRPEEASGVGTATAVALIVGSIVRLLAWYSGEYRTADDPIRLEAGVLALVALAFVWLRPPRRDRA
jgi:hypothetical protein